MTIDVIAQEFSYGLKAGTNLSSVLGNDVHCSEMKVRYQFGTFAEYRFTKIFAIEIGVYYSKQGHYYEGVINEPEGLKVKNDDKLDYLNIPITFKVYVTDKLACRNISTIRNFIKVQRF